MTSRHKRRPSNHEEGSFRPHSAAWMIALICAAMSWPVSALASWPMARHDPARTGAASGVFAVPARAWSVEDELDREATSTGDGGPLPRRALPRDTAWEPRATSSSPESPKSSQEVFERTGSRIKVDLAPPCVRLDEALRTGLTTRSSQ